MYAHLCHECVVYKVLVYVMRVFYIWCKCMFMSRMCYLLGGSAFLCNPCVVYKMQVHVCVMHELKR